MLHELILWLGAQFSPEQYLFWTRIQCLAWTAADLVIVFYAIRIANLGRSMARQAPHRIPYGILAATIPFIPFVTIAATGWGIFLLELAITIPHFCLLVYLGVANFRNYPAILAALLPGTARAEES